LVRFFFFNDTVTVQCVTRDRIVMVRWVLRKRIVMVRWVHRERIVMVRWVHRERIMMVRWVHRERIVMVPWVHRERTHHGDEAHKNTICTSLFCTIIYTGICMESGRNFLWQSCNKFSYKPHTRMPDEFWPHTRTQRSKIRWCSRRWGFHFRRTTQNRPHAAQRNSWRQNKYVIMPALR
jgi:hypothetical protein